jgi:hypothetical protein
VSEVSAVSQPFLKDLFALEERVAVVTGATGVLGGAVARGLARAGARVEVLGRRKHRATSLAEELGASEGRALALAVDVLDKERLETRKGGRPRERCGRVDILVNVAGGNLPGATVGLGYRLLPYLYTYASIAAETSVPIMRPMLLEFPTDSCVHGTDLQYMFGSELLVAPIYNSQGQRPVYLPSGRWVDYWTREVIEGPRMQHVEATLDTLPLYVRADALVPTVEPQDHLTEDPFEMVTFDCYLIDEGTFELRDTDGVTRVEASFEGTRLEIALEGAKQKIGLRLIPLPDAPQVEKVRANGSDLEMVESLRLDLNSGVGWTSDPDGALRVVVG